MHKETIYAERCFKAGARGYIIKQEPLKNIVAADLADKCEIQLAYAIGVAEPVSVHVNTFGTGKISDEDIVLKIRKVFDLTPAGIIKQLDLKRPIYRSTATYGHFGREEFSWEKTDKLEELKS